MTTNDADRRLTAWLTDVAPGREPEHLLSAVLERTARTPRRPAWRIPERWIPMTTISTASTPAGRVPWRLAAAAVLLVLAVLAGAVLLAGARQPKVPAPFGPAANGSLAYESGNGIEIRTPAGVVTSIADATGPVFSLDGTRLAWMRWVAKNADGTDRLELRVGDADGSDAITGPAFDDPSALAWSPDGVTVAVASVVDGVRTITMVDVRSGTSRVLPLGMEVDQPAFRPGGQQLVVRGRPAGDSWGLYLAGLDGAQPVRLALDPSFEQDASYGFGDNREYYFLAPAWSSQGNRLAFHTLEESTAPGDPDPGFRVHVADVDAHGTVTNETVLPVQASIDDEFDAAWLPDGSGLVARRVEEGRPSLAAWPLSTSPVAPGSDTVLGLGAFGDAIDDLRFLVAPDGKTVTAWEANDGNAYSLPIDGAPATPITQPILNAASWQRTAP